jgi:alpha-galactosidase
MTHAPAELEPETESPEPEDETAKMSFLEHLDELRRRHPNMLIDSCASGGRRNDLETLRRAVPLLRSDYIMEPVGNLKASIPRMKRIPEI